MNTWFYVVIGFLQGVFEWLPVSSKTVLMLFASFIGGVSLLESYLLALALQGGTIIAAVVFFRGVFVRVFRYSHLLEFLLVSTFVTGILGLPIYFITYILLPNLDLSITTLLVGLILLFQYFMRRKRGEGVKTINNINLVDSVLFGVAQSFAVLPGVSRSGSTIIALIFMNYKLEDAMKLSFLASIPANLGGTLLVLYTSRTVVEPTSNLLVAFLVSAVVGLLTIKYLLRVSLKHSQELILFMSLITLAAGLSGIILNIW
ncbi:MAG: undecaprenyl-diphosphate phosphatase [Desulfurococcaceae archaeon TW002]